MKTKPTHTNPARMRFFIELYSFIHKWKKENGQPPSVRDLFLFDFEGMEIKPQPSTAHNYLLRMEKLGMIERKKIKHNQTTMKLFPPADWSPIVRKELKAGETWE